MRGISVPDGIFNAVVVTFPVASPREIDEAQRRLKVGFVERGLMIGEFHADSVVLGLRTRTGTFFPLRTPCPAMAVRHLVKGDRVFLIGKNVQGFSCEDQEKMRAAYLRAFPDDDDDDEGERREQGQGETKQ
jgi:hypothetical protein